MTQRVEIDAVIPLRTRTGHIFHTLRAKLHVTLPEDPPEVIVLPFTITVAQSTFPAKLEIPVEAARTGWVEYQHHGVVLEPLAHHEIEIVRDADGRAAGMRLDKYHVVE